MKKIKSFTINIATPDTEEEGYRSYLEERDENGNVLLEEQFYMDGSLARRVNRTFDESQNLLLEKFYSQESVPDQVSEYNYFESGKLKMIKTTFAGGGVELKKYEYDEANNATTILTGDEQGDIESKEYHRYDNEDRVLEEVVYEGENELSQKTVNSFDNHGRPLARSITFGDGFITDLDYEHEMDDQGRVIGMKVQNQKGEEIYYEEFEYDDKNNIAIHYVENTEGRKTFTKKYEYDEKDRVIKEQTLNIEEIVEQEIHIQYNEEGRVSMKETNTNEGFLIEIYGYELFV